MLDKDRGNGSVNAELKTMYDNYYQDGSFKKREITAAQAIEHVRSVWKGPKVKRALDVGAGEGSLLMQMSASGFAHELHALEISTSGVEAIRAKTVNGLVDVQLFDGYKIPYPDKYFDIATAMHVLEHVEHERVFLRELSRVAERVIIEVPLEHTFRVSRSIGIGKKFGHINFYTPETLHNLISTSDMKVESSKVFANSLEYEVLLSGKVVGQAKYWLRQGFLSAVPQIAPRFMAYVGTVSCVASK